MLATVLSGAAAAQTDPCKSQQDRVNELKSMMDTTSTDRGVVFFNMLIRAHLDAAGSPQDALDDCKQRAAETEHERLLRIRSTAGNAYANAAPFSQERADARQAWNKANNNVNGHEKANDGEDGNPSIQPAPYNDGLSDFERYYCVEDGNPNQDGIQTRADGLRGGDLPDYGGSESQNVTSVTCWN